MFAIFFINFIPSKMLEEKFLTCFLSFYPNQIHTRNLIFFHFPFLHLSLRHFLHTRNFALVFFIIRKSVVNDRLTLTKTIPLVQGCVHWCRGTAVGTDSTFCPNNILLKTFSPKQHSSLKTVFLMHHCTGLLSLRVRES